MIGWIEELTNKGDKPYDHSQWKMEEDFSQLLNQSEQDYQKRINSIYELIINSDFNDPKKIDPLISELLSISNDDQMIITLGCALTLSKSPEIETWKKIRQIIRHSWEVERWIGQAMLAYSKQDEKHKAAFIELVSKIFNALEKDELESETKRVNEVRKDVKKLLDKGKIKLEELLEWDRTSSFIYHTHYDRIYHDEKKLFKLLSEINFDQYLSLLIKSKNPFLVDSILQSSSIGWYSSQFSKWAEAAEKAPKAFENDGGWVDSPLLPLLLVYARMHLQNPGKNIPRHNENDQEIAKLTEQINKLIQAVIDTLYKREDAHGIFIRWSIWLMKQILSQPQPENEFDDIRAPNFVDMSLIIAIGKKIKGKIFTHLPKDAELWEEWSLYCVRAFLAYNKLLELEKTEFSVISKHWELTPEEWYQDKGLGLLCLAKLHFQNNNVLNLSAFLIAYPLSLQDNFADLWSNLWNAASVLREVVEFDTSNDDKDSYTNRLDASNLLLLLACIGVACLEQCATKTDSSTLEEIAKLYRSLSDAVIELYYIDKTLNKNQWTILLRYLAVVRIKWEYPFDSQQASGVFTEDLKPDPKFWLDLLKTDVVELITYLNICSNSQVNSDRLKKALKEASIDLKIEKNNRLYLKDLSEKRYDIDNEVITKIDKLIV